MKFHRTPWDDNKVEYLVKWWPHFGSTYCAKQLGLTGQQVKSKVDKLQLHMLPKTERLCIDCQSDHQVMRRYGALCRACALKHRMKVRRKGELPFEKWVLDFLRTFRHRTICNLTVEYLKDLWDQQNGKCYYSGVSLLVPYYGSGRRPFSASIDRIDPSKGYEIGNVVWSSWVCNAGKSTLTQYEYITLCRKVVEHCHGDFLLEVANEA